jgi:hypothetical protein
VEHVHDVIGTAPEAFAVLWVITNVNYARAGDAENIGVWKLSTQ